MQLRLSVLIYILVIQCVDFSSCNNLLGVLSLIIICDIIFFRIIFDNVMCFVDCNNIIPSYYALWLYSSLLLKALCTFFLLTAGNISLRNRSIIWDITQGACLRKELALRDLECACIISLTKTEPVYVNGLDLYWP